LPGNVRRDRGDPFFLGNLRARLRARRLHNPVHQHTAPGPVLCTFSAIAPFSERANNSKRLDSRYYPECTEKQSPEKPTTVLNLRHPETAEFILYPVSSSPHP